MRSELPRTRAALGVAAGEFAHQDSSAIVAEALANETIVVTQKIALFL